MIRRLLNLPERTEPVMDELDQVTTLPAAMVQVANTGGCLNRYMLIEGVVEIGDQVVCDACPEQREVLDLVEIGVAEIGVAEIGVAEIGVAEIETVCAQSCGHLPEVDHSV